MTDELREALEPFLAHERNFLPEAPHTTAVMITVTIGDLRRLAAAVKGSSLLEGGGS